MVFPESLESIRYEASYYEDGGAFEDCYGIGSIVCKGSIPAYVQPGAFNGVAKDNFTLEVPESAITLYQTEPGWMDFKRISAHRELVCRPSIANAINTKTTRNLVLNAEGDWEVESMPAAAQMDVRKEARDYNATIPGGVLRDPYTRQLGEDEFSFVAPDAPLASAAKPTARA